MYTENNNNYDNYDDYNDEQNEDSYKSDKVSLFIKIGIIVVCVIILVWLVLALRKNNNGDVSYDPNVHVTNVQKVRLAAEKYFFINDNMPTNGKIKTVTLSKLISDNLVTEVVDANKKVCNDLNSVATLEEEGNSYTLKIKLNCSIDEKEEVFYYSKDNYKCLNCNGVTNMDGKTNVKEKDTEETKEDSEEYNCKTWSSWTSVKVVDSKLEERTRIVVLGVKKGQEKEEAAYTEWSEYSKTPISITSDIEVETKTEMESVWSEIKTTSSYIQNSDKVKVVSTNNVSSGSYTYCPSDYQQDGNKCYSKTQERGDLTYKEYNSGNFKVYNKPCDRINTELTSDGKYSLVYKNCLYSRITDLKTGSNGSYTVYNYQELIDTPVVYYRFRTKTMNKVKEKDVYTTEYYEEKNLPNGYEKVSGSEKTEYSYKLAVCEK